MRGRANKFGRCRQKGMDKKINKKKRKEWTLFSQSLIWTVGESRANEPELVELCSQTHSVSFSPFRDISSGKVTKKWNETRKSRFPQGRGENLFLLSFKPLKSMENLGHEYEYTFGSLVVII